MNDKRKLYIYHFFLRIFSFLLLTGLFSCTSMARNSFEDPAIPLPAYLAASPAPVWRMPLKASEIEYAELLDDRTLLMRTSQVVGYMQAWGLRNKEILLSDIESGSLLWRIETSTILSSIEEIFSSKDFIFISGWDYNLSNHRLTALNRSDGTEAWTMLFSDRFIFAYHPESNLIAGAGTIEETFQVISLKPETGIVYWKKIINTSYARANTPTIDISFKDDSCIIIGTKAACLTMNDGEVLWTSEIDPALQIFPVAAFSDNQVILYAGDSLGAYDLNEGTHLWNVREPGSIVLTGMIADGNIYMVREDNKNQSILLCLSQKTGEVLWRRELEKSLRSSLYLYNQKLYLTSQAALYTINSSDGTIESSAPLPEFMRTEYGLPDLIMVMGDTVFVDREIGLAAFNAQSLNLNYAHAVSGTELYTYHYTSQRFQLRQIARSYAMEGIDSAGMTKALQNQVIRNNTGVEPQFAQGIPRTANQAQTEATMAAASMASSIAAAGVAFREDGVAKNMSINKKEINAAISCHTMSFQHGYYIRPFYRKGWGVTLVRLADGGRADLYLSSPNEPLMINSGNFPMIFIDPVKQQLIANGTGIRPSLDETYTKVGFGREVFKVWPGIPPNWTLPYAAVFFYDLNELKFETEQLIGLPAAPPELGEKEQKLRDTILMRDREGVEKLIDSGADVNAIDQAGLNALFYAAMVDDKKIAKAIIAAGADALLRDPHDHLSYHYTFLTFGDNRSTMVFRKAVINQEKEAETP